MARILLDDFSGGWSLLQHDLALNQSRNVKNFTLGELGKLIQRGGCSLLSGQSPALASGTAKNLFYSEALGLVIAQVGTGLYKFSGAGGWANFATMTTSARVGFCDFFGKLIVIHPVDKVFHYDGTTWTGPVANSPKGNTIAVWQNALLSGGDPTADTKLTRSDIGAITWPAGPVTNDIREGGEYGDAPITCVGVGQGMDNQGRGGLIVCKRRSYHRVHDITNLAFTTLHNRAGAINALSITSVRDGLVASVNDDGIWLGDGISPPIHVSGLLDPLFRQEISLDSSGADAFVAFAFQDRFYFYVPTISGTDGWVLEFEPRKGWILPHVLGATYAGFTRFPVSNVYAGLVGLRTGGGNITTVFEISSIFDVDSGGSNVAFTCVYQTPWIPLGGLHRVMRALVRGRGTFTAKHRYNWAEAPGATWIEQTLALGATHFAEQAELRQFQVARAVQYQLSIASDATSAFTAEDTLDDANVNIVEGAAAIYDIDIETVPLGDALAPSTA